MGALTHVFMRRIPKEDIGDLVREPLRPLQIPLEPKLNIPTTFRDPEKIIRLVTSNRPDRMDVQEICDFQMPDGGRYLLSLKDRETQAMLAIVLYPDDGQIILTSDGPASHHILGRLSRLRSNIERALERLGLEEAVEVKRT